jgi:hypothetical protein
VTSDEMLDQLRKLDELVQNADPDSIEWVMDVDLDDEPLTPNRVRALTSKRSGFFFALLHED